MALSHITDFVTSQAARVLGQYRGLPKMMGVIAAVDAEVQGVEDALWDIVAQLSVSTAQGVWLDALGKIVNQARNGAVDGFFRQLISARIIANGSNGSMNDVIRAMMTVFGTPPGNGEQLKEWSYAALSLFVPDSITQFAGTPDRTLIVPALSILRGVKSAGIKASLLYQSDELANCFVWDDASNPGHVTGMGWGDAANPLTPAGQWAGAEDA